MKLVNRSVLLVIFTAVAIVAGGKELTIQDIWGTTKFGGKIIRGIHWMTDGKSYSFLETDTVKKATAIYRLDISTQKRTVVAHGANLKVAESDSVFSFTTYQWSPDEKKILFVSRPPARQYLSRHTPAGDLFLLDVPSKQFIRITDVGVPQYNQKFSPNGALIAFVRQNNLFLYDIEAKNERQLTFDGSENIINGKFDWVYEEEFGISDGWRWSPDGSKIAFWQIDQTQVPEYTMTEWDSTHLHLVTMKYPKPGDRNPVAKIGVVSVADGSIQWVNTGNSDEAYLPRMNWAGDSNTLWVQHLNRDQNVLDVVMYDLSRGKSRTVIREKSDTWIEVHDDFSILKNGDIIWASERDGYNHLYRFDKNGDLKNQITAGQWDVESMYGVDEKKGIVYYTSSEVSPVERHIHSVTIDGKKKMVLTRKPGTHSANFSPTFEHFIDNYSHSGQPTRIAVMAKNGKEIFALEESGIPLLNEYILPQVKYFTMRTTDGVDLHAGIMLPVDFDSTKKYPVLVYTYGGPGSQVVKNSWGGSTYLWHSMLTQKGYIVFMLDNRGTGLRGSAFKKMIYKNLGYWESHDQIEGAKYLGSLPFVDKNRIGIWGWSYGGYMASHTILVGSDYFKAAIAVAPVIHWKFYDTIYTERYMGTPENNPDGYKNSAPMNHAEKLKGKYLLIHGTSDDNVHFQNAVSMVSALQKANKQFETMFYPNKNHGISGGNTRVHLYTLMTNFLLENL
jgi:dipeptidyl-peptidase-4